MGIEEAVRILIKMMKEFSKHFTEEDIEDAITIGINLVYLWCKDRAPDEEDAFKAYKSALIQIANQIQLAAINEAEQYTRIGKIIEVLS